MEAHHVRALDLSIQLLVPSAGRRCASVDHVCGWLLTSLGGLASAILSPFEETQPCTQGVTWRLG